MTNKTHKIFECKDGRWRVYVYNEDGKRRMISGKTKEAVEAKLNKIYKEAHQVEDDLTMQKLFFDWIEYKKLHVASSSISRITNTWNRYFSYTFIAQRPIKEISKIELDKFIHSTIINFSLTKKEFANFSSLLNQLLDYAVDLDIIPHNIKREIKISRNLLRPDSKKTDETQVFSEKELLRLKKIAFEEFENDVYPINSLLPLAAVFMFDTGLRIGEIVVLKWSDIKDDSLIVRRMYRHSTKEIIDDTKGVFGERTVPLVPEAKQILDLCRTKQKERNVRTSYVFSMKKCPAPYSGLQKIFYKYSSHICKHQKSSHKARKTFISTLIDGGVNINTVRQIAGHVDEATTLHNYTFDRATDSERLSAITSALTPKSSKNIKNIG